MKLRGALGGILVGALTAGASLVLAEATKEPAFAVISLLAVATVGLTLGAAAALWTYAISGVVLIVQAIITPESLIAAADVVRVVAFVLGAPVVVLLAMRLERERRGATLAMDLSVAAERQALRDRGDAEAARRELHAALQQVEEQRTRLEEVAGAIAEPLIVYDADGRGTYANRAAMRTFGRSFIDRPPEEWGRLANPRDDRGNPLSPELWPQLRARQEATSLRMLVHIPMSGRDLLVDVEGTPVPDGGCVLLLRDVGQEVDERRRLSRFGSFVAHELRNPLAVAKARVELASREPALPARAADHARRALESVDAAIGILERLELFSRAEAGRVEAVIDEFSLLDASNVAIESLRARGSERLVEVEVAGDPRIPGDRQLTEQALTNLLMNADRYSTDDGPIRIKVSTGSVPEVRVSDGGPGIPDEVADLLFRDRVSSGRGLGLGLYLVRAAMEAQGGSAQLEQRRPGAIFLLRWPLRGTGQDAEAAAGQPE